MNFYFHYISFYCIILLYPNVSIQPLAAICNEPLIDWLTDWLIDWLIDWWYLTWYPAGSPPMNRSMSWVRSSREWVGYDSAVTNVPGGSSDTLCTSSLPTLPILQHVYSTSLAQSQAVIAWHKAHHWPEIHNVTLKPELAVAQGLWNF